MASANATYGQKESSDQNFDYMFKILIIGNSSVGKTSFLFRYADDSFTPAFVSTVGIDFKVKTIYRNDKRIKLQIWVRKSTRTCMQACWGCQLQIVLWFPEQVEGWVWVTRKAWKVVLGELIYHNHPQDCFSIADTGGECMTTHLFILYYITTTDVAISVFSKVMPVHTQPKTGLHYN